MAVSSITEPMADAYIPFLPPPECPAAFDSPGTPTISLLPVMKASQLTARYELFPKRGRSEHEEVWEGVLHRPASLA